MYPGKDYCAICNGVSEEWDCSLQGGLLCNPGRKAEPQYIDFDTRAKAAGYVHLEPGQVVVEIADAEALTEFFNDFCPPAWIFEACERINHAIKEARDE